MPHMEIGPAQLGAGLAQIEAQFFKNLVDIGGPDLLRCALGNRALGPELSAEFNRALRGCLGTSGDPISDLGFCARWKPASSKAAGRRPADYWQTAEMWAGMVFSAARKLPHGVVSEELLRDARFFRAVTTEATVWSRSGNFQACKPARGLLWHLELETGDRVGMPVYWRVLSPYGVEVRDVQFESSDGRKVTAVLLYRNIPMDESRRAAAACEAVDGEWSRWRVSSDSFEAFAIAEQALLVPHERRARIGDQVLMVSPEPPPLELRNVSRYSGRLHFRPEPSKVRANSSASLWFFGWEEGVDEVRVSHPDHYEVQLRIPKGYGVEVGFIPGSTWPTPDGYED